MTKDCYQIICDEQAMKDFINWLPDHTQEETYFYSLFTRPKYSIGVKRAGGGNLLFRGISDKKSLLRKFRQLECPIGAYEKKGESIPQESLALYINPNPRSFWRATLNSLSALSEIVKREDKKSSPHKECLSAVQTSVKDKYFIDFDIDNKEPLLLQEVVKILSGRCEIIETRGGYHILVRVKSIPEIQDKIWYKKLSEMSDSVGDVMIPVPGSFQGGFVPKFISPQDFIQLTSEHTVPHHILLSQTQ